MKKEGQENLTLTGQNEVRKILGKQLITDFMQTDNGTRTSSYGIWLKFIYYIIISMSRTKLEDAEMACNYQYHKNQPSKLSSFQK